MRAKTHATTATSNADHAAVQECDEEQHHGGTLEGGATQMTALTSSMPTAALVVPTHLVDALPGDHGDGAPPELEDLPIHQKCLLDVDSKSQNNNKSVLPEKQRVDTEEPPGKKHVQIAQAKGLATTQSWVDMAKSKPKERLKGALAPIIKQ
jgi:hypothetical protein